MNKYILIALALVVLIGGGVYITRQANPSSQAPTSETSSSYPNRGSINSLLGLGTDVTCQMTSPDGSSGVVFVSNNQVRGEFTMPDARTSNMIKMGDTVYMWPMGDAGGIKMTVSEQTEAEATEDTTSETQQEVDLNSEAALTCEPWTADPEVFVPPVDITFTDVSELMMQAPPTGQ